MVCSIVAPALQDILVRRSMMCVDAQAKDLHKCFVEWISVERF